MMDQEELIEQLRKLVGRQVRFPYPVRDSITGATVTRGEVLDIVEIPAGLFLSVRPEGFSYSVGCSSEWALEQFQVIL
jgi:hypothetical protein